MVKMTELNAHLVLKIEWNKSNFILIFIKPRYESMKY